MRRKPKVYIAAAFRSLSERDDGDKAYGVLKDKKHIEFLEEIESIFQSRGFATCLPHRDEGHWGKLYYHPDSISAICFRHVETSDVVFSIAEKGRGVHIELGYAYGLGDKKIIMMHNESHEPSTLVHGMAPKNIWGLDSDNNLFLHQYADLDSLKENLNSILDSLGYEVVESDQSLNFVTTIVDIGSHTIKSKTYSHGVGKLPIAIDSSKSSLGIIDDIHEEGVFAKSTIEKLVETINSMIPENVDQVKLIGTEAIRQSENTDVLINKINDELNLKLEILDQQTELNYVYSGISETLHTDRRFAVLNLGGGSIQFGSGVKNDIQNRVYYDFGTNFISKEFPWKSALKVDEFERMYAYVKDKLRLDFKIETDKPKYLIYTGGELDFMLKCRLPLETCHISNSHVSMVSVGDFKKFVRQFNQLEPSYVSKNFNIDEKWLSGSAAANLIALSIAELSGVTWIIPSNFNISEGILS